ncbi:hypothetical protein ACSXEQ_04875 [Clostridium perfringens]|uniref:hypothetical protein n=1 Tax=Clostridium perfringens TaxID=1502 RepID=UPI003F41EF4B
MNNKPNSDNKHDLEAIAFAELNQENKNNNVLEKLFIKLKNYIKLSEYMELLINQILIFLYFSKVEYNEIILRDSETLFIYFSQRKSLDVTKKFFLKISIMINI